MIKPNQTVLTYLMWCVVGFYLGVLVGDLESAGIIVSSSIVFLGFYILTTYLKEILYAKKGRRAVKKSISTD